jgi:DNA-binding Lrp family transcriptional regulator
MQGNITYPNYVFASVEPHMLDDVVNHLKTLSGSTWFSPVTGRFDLVVRLEWSDTQKLYSFVNKIRGIPGIMSTQTYIPLEGFVNGESMENGEPLGLVLLRVNEQVPKVLQALKRIPQIAEAFSTPGEFDIVATLKSRNYEEIITQVQKIADVKGVKTSETLFAYKPIYTA